MMRLLMIAVVAVAVGLAGGSYLSGNRLKDEILAERAAARADSLEAEASAPETGSGARPADEGTSDVGRDGHLRPSPEASVPAFAGFDTERVAPAPRERDGPGVDTASAPAVAAATSDPPEAGGGGVPPDSEDGSSGDEAASARGNAATERVAEAAASGAAEAAADSAAIQGAIQLARMFSAMKPVDAAAVLQELTDPEVEAIMRHMQSRLAGQILGAFEPRRAALLSRVVLGGAPDS